MSSRSLDEPGTMAILPLESELAKEGHGGVVVAARMIAVIGRGEPADGGQPAEPLRRVRHSVRRDPTE